MISDEMLYSPRTIRHIGCSGSLLSTASDCGSFYFGRRVMGALPDCRVGTRAVHQRQPKRYPCQSCQTATYLASPHIPRRANLRPPLPTSQVTRLQMVAAQAVKAVFFDLDDTLCITSGFDKVAWEECRKLATAKYPQLDGAKLIEDFRALFGGKPWDVEHKIDVTKWRANLWLQALQTQSIDDESLSEAIQNCYDSVRYGSFDFLEGVEDMLKQLEAKGIATCIITNGHHKVQRDKLAACNAYRLFPNIIVGGEEVLGGRKEKPDAGIFRKALQYVGCEAHEVLHIGDSLGSDIQGGINAGLGTTVWVNPSGTPAPEGKPQPTYTVKLCTELPAVIDKIEQCVARS